MVVAFVSIVASYLSQWRSLRSQHTFQALQTLRTDREYLINALKVEATLKDLGREMTATEISWFHNPVPQTSVDKPSFSQASRFLLNQYEFMAAACRQGMLDETMLALTTKSVLCGLVRSYRPIIEQRRAHHPESLANLVWLYRRLSKDRKLELGPAIPMQNGLLKTLGTFLRILPAAK